MQKSLIKACENAGKWLDKLTPYDKWIGGLIGEGLEAIDGWSYTRTLIFIAKKIDPKYHNKFEAFLNYVVAENWNAVADFVSDELVSVINSSLGDGIERIVISGQFDIIKKIIDFKMNDGYSKFAQIDPGQGPPDKDPD